MKEGNATMADEGEEPIVMPHSRSNGFLTIGVIIVAVIVILAAALATGFLSSGPTGEPVTITGAGATFPMPLILKWADVYHNKTGGKIQINYGGGGSGAGITQVKDRHVDFAGTDAPLGASESTNYGLVHIPETLGAVVVAYNEPSIVSLKLDGPVLARIFMKNITSWDDPTIAALNPGVTLPTSEITTVVRSDSSGTTFVFSGYLAKISEEFDALYGQGKSVSWPDAIGASGNPGVAQTIKTTTNSIGYIELAYAMMNDVPFAQLKNHDGHFVTPTLEGASAAAEAAASDLPAGDGDWSNVEILDAPGAASYPIASFTYILIYKELYSDESKMNESAATALIEFLWWAVHDGGQAYADGLHYAPLPASVVSVNEATLNSITYKGDAVR